MRILTTVLSLCILLGVCSCGDEGVGFNIGKEVPVTIPVDLPIGDSRLGSTPLDPVPFTETGTYDLNEVTTDDVDDIVLNSISYALTEISAAEEVALDALTIELSGSNGNYGSIDITTPMLQNVAKTQANFSAAELEALTNALLRGETISTEVTFDFGEYPSEDLLFDFTFYFDVIAKVRD